MEESMTVQEVAHRLHASSSTISRWCSEGRLPAAKVGRNWRIWRRTVEGLGDEGDGKQELMRLYRQEVLHENSC